MNGNVGFIGFGEVGLVFAEALVRTKAVKVLAYDRTFANGHQDIASTRRAGNLGVELHSSLEDLLRGSTTVLSLVTAATAHQVAEDASGRLTPDHVYVDLNSVSPGQKLSMARVIEQSGASFVEGAIMASVATLGANAPVFVCGTGPAEQTVIHLRRLGLNISYLGSELGQASTMKICRSIISKGLEALLIESLGAAHRFGVAQEVLDLVQQGYPGLDWADTANFLLRRSVKHGKRRAAEMREARDALEELGQSTFMAAAIANCLEDSSARLSAAFAPNGGHAELDSLESILDELNRLDRGSADNRARSLGLPSSKRGSNDE